MSQPTPDSLPPTPFAHWLPAQRTILLLTLATASGLLFAGALPPHNIEWLGWFAWVPLFVAVSLPGLRPERTLHALGLGILAGMTTGVAQVGWVSSPGATLQFAYLPYIWISLVIGVVAAVAGYASNAKFGGVRWMLTVACAGVAVEWLTTFSPLPVGIALCEHRTILVLQIADTTGIWGVSFLLYLTNAALAQAIIRRRVMIAPIVVALAIMAVSLSYDILRVTTEGGGIDFGDSRPSATVAAIQDFSGADSAGLASTTAESTSAPEKEDLIRTAARRGARLIVGTEEAWGATFRPNDPKDAVAALARETKSTLVVGFSQSASANGSGKDWNCAGLISPSGATLGVHHKMRLFLGERQTVQAGDRAHAFETPIGKVGLLICFDSCYTNATRQAVSDGAQIIAMPNYDPPTVHAVLHELHAALIPFRAVENRVAFVRADPNGLSQIVAPNGRIWAETGMYRAEALVSAVRLGDGQGTFFTRWGDWFAYLCVGGVIGLLCLRRTYRATAAVTPNNTGTPRRSGP